MAGASLLALIDDIASILDDVAVMTKVAAKKMVRLPPRTRNQMPTHTLMLAK